MLRTLGKVIAGVAAVTATTYFGKKILAWAGVTKKPK